MAGEATVQFKFPNKPLFRSKGRDAIRIMAEEGLKALGKAASIITREAQKESPRVFSELARSIFPEITMRPLMAIIMPHVEYASIVHEGRRAGRQPPAAPLQLWARRKFGFGESEAWSVAFAVAKKIASRGTEGNPFMTRALKNTRSDIDKVWAKGRDIIVRRLS